MKFRTALVVIALGAGFSQTAIAQDKVGIEACDTFLEKYEACMKNQVGAQRAQFDQMITQLRSSWKQMADNPQTKPSLEQSCKQTTGSIKQSLNAAPYNCGF
jgi:hypothetical protein